MLYFYWSEYIGIKRQMNKENVLLAIKRCNLNNPEMRYVVDHVKCFTCLDTRQLWRDREGLPFSAWDGRGKYDVIKCNSCSTGHWDRCSSTPDIKVNNYKLFKKGNNDLTVRVKEMEKESRERYVMDEVKKLSKEESVTPKRRTSVSLVESMVKGMVRKRMLGDEEEDRRNEQKRKEEERKEQIKREEERKEEERKEKEMKETLPEWWLSKSRVIQRDATKVGIEVAVKEIAEDVFALIKGYSGDLLHIANWAKDFTISMSSTLESCSSTNAHVEQFQDKKDGSTTYLILKYEKTDSVKTYNYYAFTRSKEKTSILSKVFLFKPKNETAERICVTKVNDIIIRNMAGLDV